jgi:Rieske Fe-S protein
MARQARVDPARTPEMPPAEEDDRPRSPTRSPSATPTRPPSTPRTKYRSIKPELFVGVGICTHLGCSPTDKLQPGPQPSLPDDWQGGFLCPCHGSTFDLAGRVFKNKPAPDNLEVPPHMYLSDTRLLIGEDKKEGLRSTMAEFKEISPNASAGAKLGNWFNNRFPTFGVRAFCGTTSRSTTPRRTSTSGTSSARWRCWCW